MFDHLLVYDVESASLDVKDGIVEHAWIEIDDDMNELDRVQSLIKPSGPISFSAMGLHGITEDMVADSPTIEEHLGGRFTNKSVLVTCHNAIFDQKYLRPHCGDLRTVCTLKLSRTAFPESPDHKLTTLVRALSLPVLGAHNALDDVSSTLALLRACGERLGLDLEGMYKLCNTPKRVEKMTFSKYKGWKVKDLPQGMVTWLLAKDNLDSDLRWTLENPE